MRKLIAFVAWFGLAVGCILCAAIFKSFFTDVKGLLIGSAGVETDSQRWLGIALCSFIIFVSIGILLKLRALRYSIRMLLGLTTAVAIVLEGGHVFVACVALLPFYIWYRMAAQ